MKKSLSYVLLGVMAFSALAGCNKKGNGGEASGSQAPASESVAPSGDSGSSSVAPAKSDWTDDEKALMSRLLYGQVLPFFEKEGAVVSAEKDSHDVETGKLLIEGGTATATSMTAYAAKFTAAGYSVSDISASVGLESGRAFRAEKSVQVESATKYIRAEFCPVSSATGQPASAGVLSLVAADPYDYAWPAEMLAQELKSAFGTDVVIPDPEAPRYEFDSDANGFYCTAYSAPEGYAAKLTAFSVAGEAGADGFYKADPSDGLFEAYFKYADGNLYLKVTPLHSWPAASIAGFFAKHSLEAFSFPQMTVEGSTYQFMEMPDQGEGPYFVVLIAGGTEAALSTYISGLDTDVYKVSPSSGNYYIEFTVPDKGVANIMYRYMQGYGVACYVWGELGALPAAEFPAAEVAAQLGASVTDVIPAFSGCDSYQINDGFVACTCTDTSKYEALISAYVTALGTAEWTANGVQAVTADINAPHYNSPNNQIDISWFVYNGVLRFNFKNKVFDAAQYKALAKKAAGSEDLPTDQLPQVAGVNYYAYNDDSYGQYITCVIFDNLDTKYTNYIAALGVAGFTEAGEDASHNPIYNSPNKQYAVSIEKGSNRFYINFLAPVVIAATWPTEGVASLVSTILGEGFVGEADVVPALNGAASYSVDSSGSRVVVEFADAEALTSALSSYVSGLSGSHYNLEGNVVYSSEHAQYDIGVFQLSETTIEICIYKQTPVAASWIDSGAALDAMFGTSGAFSSLPSAFDGEWRNLGFEYIGTQSSRAYFNYSIVFDGNVDASTKIATYEAALLAAGFTSAGSDHYFYTPEMNGYVCVMSSYNVLIIQIVIPLS